MPDRVGLGIDWNRDLSAQLQIAQSNRALRYPREDNEICRRVVEVGGPNRVRTLLPYRSKELVETKVAWPSGLALRNQSNARRLLRGGEYTHRSGPQHTEKKKNCGPAQLCHFNSESKGARSRTRPVILLSSGG